ncbi:hypothetical protein glysoja_007384 [Glycine soja]|nr:hypothetical protein glysoja_007384 [Glycine soja]
MELSFTQGRWNYDRWGGFDSISSCNAKPPDPSDGSRSGIILEQTLTVVVQPSEQKAGMNHGFLHIDEYPPDVNQGFDIPSAIISFPDFHDGLQFSDKSRSKSPLLSKLQEKSPVLSYTELLLVPLSLDDF